MLAKNGKIILFSGNANPALAQKISDKLGTPLGSRVLKPFADGEVSLSLGETVRGKDAFIIQPTCRPVNDNLMELLIMIDAMKRASAGRITAVIPYFGYARQDRKAKSRDPISAKLVANLISVAGASRVLTMDLHAAQIQGFFDIPVDNLFGAPLLSKHFLKLIGKSNDDFVVVSPDVGSVARARIFAQSLDVALAIVDKRRQRANDSEVMNIIGNVKDKNVIIMDDIVDTAGSLCGAVDALVNLSGAKAVYACASHGVLSGQAIERIENSTIKTLYLLDTIPYPPEKPKSTKIKYLSADALFAEAIMRIHDEDSISDLFE